MYTQFLKTQRELNTSLKKDNPNLTAFFKVAYIKREFVG